MAKRVFFSFHYADIWRVNQIRNCWMVLKGSETAGFVDAAEFERVEREGQHAIERWIDRQLDGTSTTIVLIGSETASRRYVQYEIRKSYERRNRLLGIWLNNMKDKNGATSWWRGDNPFEAVQVETSILLARTVANTLNVPIYDWINDDGRQNIATWIDKAPGKGPNP